MDLEFKARAVDKGCNVAWVCQKYTLVYLKFRWVRSATEIEFQPENSTIRSAQHLRKTSLRQSTVVRVCNPKRIYICVTKRSDIPHLI